MAPETASKRKAESHSSSSSGQSEKRAKMKKKQWRVPRRGDDEGEAATAPAAAKTIQPGDSGIWATCIRGKEGKCVGELRDLFDEYATTMYGGDGADGDDGGTVESKGIEEEIEAEVANLHRPGRAQLFTPVRLGVPCVVFFKTVSPVEPVAFVKRVCQDAIDEPQRKRTRVALRLSPMTSIGRASEEGLEKVARDVLAPHFHSTPVTSRKFAIRPTLRNHNTMNRDAVIKQVASIVGPGHVVDLKNYELLIVVEVYQNICGVSVVDDSYERLKRYNLAEIFDPTRHGAIPENGEDGRADSKGTNVEP